jgi:hypothetical protein
MVSLYTDMHSTAGAVERVTTKQLLIGDRNKGVW